MRSKYSKTNALAASAIVSLLVISCGQANEQFGKGQRIMPDIDGANGTTPGSENSEPVSLSAEQNITLVAPDNTKATLSRVFTKSRMLIHFSSNDCDSCGASMAEIVDRSASISTKCDVLVLVNRHHISEFLGKTAAELEKNVWGINMNQAAFSKRFSARVDEAPATLVIDRSGKTLAATKGEDMDDIEDACK